MENFEFEIAESFIKQTNTAVFLTGKAGTGKTTFLRHIIRNTSKKSIVIAPTGVAAINAGGVTIHSMFGLPTKSFIPTNDYVDPNLANNQQMLSTHFHYNRDKLQVIHELELLVIDEVSMVRADIMDAIDFALRYTRRSTKPFGGVQVLVIGDMYQLPPVVKDDEWPLLSKYYNSPYFFDSHVFKKIDPVYVELKKIYRQSDNNFIRILNNIRHQDLQEDDYEDLKAVYQKDFEPEEPGFITLTTHNKKADAINEKELVKLDGREMHLAAEVSGEFAESMYPTESVLRLKKGAQVMFVKNDTSGERKYFNGKIGIVEDHDYEDGITVGFPNSDEKILVTQELWENIKYSVNGEENKIEQNRVGSFKQYPLRLAWAITIHKSQGLTFDKAVIDCGDAFAPGQVYVALSRCTSMKNMVLHSMITNRNIFSDPRIVDFSRRIMSEMTLENNLEQGKRIFALEQFILVFSYQKLLEKVAYWEKSVLKIKSIDRLEVLKWAASFEKTLEQMQAVGLKFHAQINSIVELSIPEDEKLSQLQERATKAIDYFVQNLYVQIIQPWEIFTSEHRYKTKMKKYYELSNHLLLDFWRKVEEMYGCALGEEKMYTGIRSIFPEQEVLKGAKKKASKGDTFQDTLDLYREGKTVAEIAVSRGLAIGTIETHLARWISRGEVDVKELMPENRIAEVLAAIQKVGDAPSSAVKANLPDDYTFNEIRFVLNSLVVQGEG